MTRKKHQPTRTCVACRRARNKRELVRLVRSPAGAVVVDETGRAPGRGAYLCAEQPCWERAVQRRILHHALRTTLDPANAEQLLAHAGRYQNDYTNDTPASGMPRPAGDEGKRST